MTTTSGVVQLPAKPQEPSLAAMADELGIARGVKGWRDRVRARMDESDLRRAWRAEVAASDPKHAGLIAAGLEHLVGARFERSGVGSWGAVIGRRVVALTRYECVALGLTPGPGNQ